MPAAAVLNCDECGSEIEHPRTRTQRFCSAAYRERARESRRRLRPEQVAATRARCREWSRSRGETKRKRPWLLGAPPAPKMMPGGTVGIGVWPPPKWPLEHRNIRALHGMVTSLTGPHRTDNVSRFSLLPARHGIQWATYLGEDALADELSGAQREARLFDRDVIVQLTPAMRWQYPRVERRGKRQLRIDAITPVCVRSNGRTSGERPSYTAPSGGNLASTLDQMLVPRLTGVAFEPGSICLRMIYRATEARTVHVGGKLGVTRGWVGHCIVEANAVGEWLLRCAAVMGLGGRTAWGFGRVVVSDAE